jgi:hypothetical protein
MIMLTTIFLGLWNWILFWAYSGATWRADWAAAW